MTAKGCFVVRVLSLRPKYSKGNMEVNVRSFLFFLKLVVTRGEEMAVSGVVCSSCEMWEMREKSCP